MAQALIPPSIRRILFLILPAAIAIALTACSSTTFKGTTQSPVVTVTANPASITAGGSSTLTVTATNANVVTLAGSDGSSYTLSTTGGTQVVSPSATTTYTATANGTGGSGSAAATVTVNAPAAPTVNMTASPATVNAGQSSTLTVTATNAATVTISGSDGSSYTLAATGGTQVVTPAATTNYTATATSASGAKVTANATVTVSIASPAATVTIAANPTAITTGQSSTLTVAATNATNVTITGSDGSSYALAAAGGTQVVKPASTTTYTATATGAGGNATATATVTVNPVGPGLPTVTITANPTTITAGASSTLSVAASNAASVTIAGSDGTSYTLSATGGTQVVTPTATTTYTATATNANGNTTATAIVTVNPTITITANPTTITGGSSSTLTVTAVAATQVTVTGSDGTSYTLAANGGTQSVKPTADTTYTATATGSAGTPNATATATVTVIPAGSLQSIQHVIFMMQENHTFDNYFGMLNPYRHSNGYDVGDDGVTYTVDGIDDKLSTISNEDDEHNAYNLFKLKSTCIDDASSAWLESYGDVNRYDFSTTRKINMDGFVHNAEGFAKSCSAPGAKCAPGDYSDTKGQRAMGYYDQDYLNYYYYMASQFSMSDRWFSPISSKSVDNRIATFSGGTTRGLVKDPANDGLPQLSLPNIFQELDQNGVSWKIYYTGLQCTPTNTCGTGGSQLPATFFSNFTYSYKYLYNKPSGAACTPPTQPDPSNSVCIDPNHIAPISQYYTDVAGTNGTSQLPSFAFIEAGYGSDDEHPGSGQSVLTGQYQVAQVVNSLMASKASWGTSAFFLSYDEGGGPYEHVPPVPGHSNDYTDPAVKGSYPDISSIAVNPDSYGPCVPSGGTTPSTPPYCDLGAIDPGAHTGDAPVASGFAAQLGFRVPNFVVSPFARKHYVSHTPMDHTAVIKFVEDRFIGSSVHYLTARDAAQPNLLDLFDFSTAPWMTPPSPPAPVTKATLGYDPCTPQTMQ